MDIKHTTMVISTGQVTRVRTTEARYYDLYIKQLFAKSIVKVELSYKDGVKETYEIVQ
jgi:hypothetical protein